MRKVVAVVVAAVLLVGAITWLWMWYHSKPRVDEIRRWLREATSIEVVELKGAKPVRFVRIDQPDAWRDLPDLLHFRETFWRFSDEPDEAILLQTFRTETERTGAVDVRADECLHIRKGARWYRMPIEPGLRSRLQAWLDARGVNVRPAPNPTAGSATDKPRPSDAATAAPPGSRR